MALAPLAHVLFTRIMKYDAAAPDWPDRDRFVLSNGHASMLLYTMLYLTGCGLTLDDLRDFRQWGSKTAGHPEYTHVPGIEVTTGPLGQGFANGVGIGLAEANLRVRFGEEVVDHHTFVFCGDGDLEEGVSHEAASIAGHLGLGRLTYVYDDNHITIDGPTELSYTDNVPERFGAYGWHIVQLGEVANDIDALERGLRGAMAETARPSLVVLRSHIGYPSPKYTDTAKAHGEALGADEVAAVKAILGLPAEDFYSPDDVVEYYRAAGAPGRRAPRGVGAASRRVQRVRARDGRPARRVSRKPGAGRLGVVAAGVEGRRGARHPPGVRQDRQRGARRRARAGGGRGRSHRQHRHGARGSAGDRHARVRRSRRALRHPRARHGRRDERHGGQLADARRRHVLRLQRLHARRGASGRALALQVAVRVDPRLGGSR